MSFAEEENTLSILATIRPTFDNPTGFIYAPQITPNASVTIILIAAIPHIIPRYPFSYLRLMFHALRLLLFIPLLKPLRI